MGYRFHTISGLGAVALLAVLTMAAHGSPLASASTASVAPLPYALKIACGWDYPCPPEPGIRRRNKSWRQRQQQGQVYIHNNYGPVTIHVDGQEKPSGNAPPPPCCEEDRRAEDWPPPCGSEPCAEEKPKEDCGARCWWKRIRSGYCGHGCWSYREQTRLEEEEKEEKEERKREKKAEQEAEKEARREGWDYPPGYYWHPYGNPPAPPLYERP